VFLKILAKKKVVWSIGILIFDIIWILVLGTCDFSGREQNFCLDGLVIPLFLLGEKIKKG